MSVRARRASRDDIEAPQGTTARICTVPASLHVTAKLRASDLNCGGRSSQRACGSARGGARAQAIARAALELFDRQGFARDDDRRRSPRPPTSRPRTVSGYFPPKEELAFPDGDGGVRARSRRASASAPPGETAADALRAWIEGWLQAHAARGAERAQRRRVMAADEGAARLRAPLHAARAGDDRRGDRARPRRRADDLEPRMAAAATVTVFDLLGETLTTDALFEGEEVRAGGARAARPRARLHRRRHRGPARGPALASASAAHALAVARHDVAGVGEHGVVARPARHAVDDAVDDVDRSSPSPP